MAGAIAIEGKHLDVSRSGLVDVWNMFLCRLQDFDLLNNLTFLKAITKSVARATWACRHMWCSLSRGHVGISPSPRYREWTWDPYNPVRVASSFDLAYTKVQMVGYELDSTLGL